MIKFCLFLESQAIFHQINEKQNMWNILPLIFDSTYGNKWLFLQWGMSILVSCYKLFCAVWQTYFES